MYLCANATAIVIVFTYTYIVGSESVEHVVRQAGEKVNHKPGFNIVALDNSRIRDHLTARSNEGRVEIEQNIYGKYNIYDTVCLFMIIMKLEKLVSFFHICLHSKKCHRQAISCVCLYCSYLSTMRSILSSVVLFRKATLYGTMIAV